MTRNQTKDLLWAPQPQVWGAKGRMMWGNWRKHAQDIVWRKAGGERRTEMNPVGAAETLGTGRRVGCVLVMCQKSFPKLPAWQPSPSSWLTWQRTEPSVSLGRWVCDCGECWIPLGSDSPVAWVVWGQKAGEIRTRQGENWHVIPSRLGAFLRCWNRGSQAHETVAKVAPSCSKRTQVEPVSFKHPH